VAFFISLPLKSLAALPPLLAFRIPSRSLASRACASLMRLLRL